MRKVGLVVVLAVAVVLGGAGAARADTDTTPPTIAQPSNVLVAATNPQTADVPFTVTATDPDNDPSTLMVQCFWSTIGRTFPSGTTSQVFYVGHYTLTCTASDPAGNVSAAVSFTIDVTPFVDKTPPVLQLNNIVAPASSPAGTTVAETVGATDPDDPSSAITVTCDHSLANALFPVGVTTVTCNAHDPARNQAVPASFTVTVTQFGASPIIQDVPAPITAAETNASGAVVRFTKPIATDKEDGQVAVTCDHKSGDTFPAGTTTVTCNARDSAGNNAIPATFTVTITGGTNAPAPGGNTTTPPATGGTTTPPAAGGTKQPATHDTTAPTISRHAAIKVDANSPAGAVVTYAVAASDPDDAAAQIVVSCSSASGSTFPLGHGAKTRTATVTCNAHDRAGNAATPESFTVTVLGVHDQIVALEGQVSAASSVSKSHRATLVATLGRADRDFAAGAKAMAKSQLTLFAKQVLQLPSPLRRIPTAWIGAATRINSVSA
jgi:hypothetical protein